MNLLVAIPAWNEESSIGNVIQEVKNNLPQATVLVINDGSTDKTLKVANEFNVKVISMPFNVGVGGALRVAFKYARENSYSHVLQIDADGQHLASEATSLLTQSTNDSIIIGSRFLNGSGTYKVGFSRRFAMLVLAKITQIICRTKLTDVTSGFRLTSGSAIELFSREYPRDYLGDTVESLIIAHQNGIKISEVPVEIKQRQHGAPSQNLVKSLWYLNRILLVIVLSVFKKSREKSV